MKELDLSSFFLVLLQNLRLIIAVVIAMAIIFAVATGVLTEDTFSSRCSVYVMNVSKDADDNYTGISTGGLEASQRMVEEYIIILRSNNIIEEVTERVNAYGYEVTPSAVRESLTMSAVENTALLRIISTTSDAELSKIICDELLACAPEKVKNIMNGLGSISPVDAANLGTRNAPRVTRNAVLGGAFGLLLICGLILLRYLMDNTVKDEKDLKNRFNVNVLGVVMDNSSLKGTAADANRNTTGGRH